MMQVGLREPWPIGPGDAWGPPWGTTWFVITADLPPSWAGGHVEVEIDLGFRRIPPGFQCEGLIVDDDGEPVAGVHPRHRRHRVEAVADVRSHPYSRHHPQYRRDALRDALTRAGVDYLFLGRELGAKSRKDSRCFTYLLTMSFISPRSGLERIDRLPRARMPNSIRPAQRAMSW